MKYDFYPMVNDENSTCFVKTGKKTSRNSEVSNRRSENTTYFSEMSRE